MVSLGPGGLSMLVQDVFFVRAPGKGTVLTGHLDGDGQLRVGDYLACDGTTYEVLGIEQFKRVLKEIGSGANAGIALGTEVPKEQFAGKTVTFQPRPGAGVPALPVRLGRPPERRRSRRVVGPPGRPQSQPRCAGLRW